LLHRKAPLIQHNTHSVSANTMFCFKFGSEKGVFEFFCTDFVFFVRNLSGGRAKNKSLIKISLSYAKILKVRNTQIL
jgi:hypothetical protein